MTGSEKTGDNETQVGMVWEHEQVSRWKATGQSGGQVENGRSGKLLKNARPWRKCPEVKGKRQSNQD